MLFKQLTLVFIPKALLKTGPPSLGILYIEKDKGNLDASGLYASDIDYMYTDYKKTCMCDLLGFATSCCSYSKHD